MSAKTMGGSYLRLLPILLLIKAKINQMEVIQVNTATNISQQEAYKLMLKSYPDVLTIQQMCEILGISRSYVSRIETKALSILRENQFCLV